MCCRVMSCRRAISATLAPLMPTSDRTLSFSSSDQRRRRSTPIRTCCRIARLPDDVNNDVVSDANLLLRRARQKAVMIGRLRTINRQSIKVPDYVWERDSQSGRWMQVAGAGNMAAASGTLAFVDYPIWGSTDMGFVIADGAIFVGTAGTAVMTAVPNKKA